MSTLSKFKQQVKSRNTKNFAFVKVRATRYCDHCLNAIAVGTECLTLNTPNKKRRWHCMRCVEARLNVMEAAKNLNSIAFGDEGGYMAAQEWYDEALEDFYELGDEDYYPHEDD